MPKKFNVLIDDLPDSIDTNGRLYDVNTDYRIVLSFFALQGADGDEEEKARKGISLFIGDVLHVDDIKTVTDWIGWFIRCGEEPKKDSNAPVFDLLEDSGRIFAAFFQVYGINLRKVKMHWWVFRELLDGLPKGTKLSDVVEIRQKPFEKWMSPADRNALQKQKDYYRIGEKKEIGDQLFGLMNAIAR